MRSLSFTTPRAWQVDFWRKRGSGIGVSPVHYRPRGALFSNPHEANAHYPRESEQAGPQEEPNREAEANGFEASILGCGLLGKPI